MPPPKTPKLTFPQYKIDYEVRVGEVGDKKKKMKCFSSNLLKDNVDRFAPMLEVADDCREALWSSQQEVMEKFRNWND